MLEIVRLGSLYGWQKGSGDWEGVREAIAHQDPIQVIQEAGSTQWQTELPSDHSFYFGFPEYTATQRDHPPTPKARIWISAIQRRFAPESKLPKVQWHPRVLWVGVGCERGVSSALIDQAIQEIFQANHLAELAIAALTTIDTKSNEAGLLEFCGQRHLPLRYFSAEALRSIRVPNPSAVVDSRSGTPSVSEAAAILGSGNPDLLIAKKIFRVEGSGAVTIAVAQSNQEYADQEYTEDSGQQSAPSS
ncbi:cobalamin biosynthesis protein [Phormidesmis sp. 146-35]